MDSFTVDVQVMGIRDGRTSKFQIDVANDLRVIDLKKLIAGPSAVPEANQRIVYKGNMLPDKATLGSCGVLSNTTIHLAPLMKKTGNLQAQLGGVVAMLSTKPVAGIILALIFGLSILYNTLDAENIRNLPSTCIFVGFCAFILHKVMTAKVTPPKDAPKDEEEIQVPICPGGG
jgi:hypothetical protein